MFGTIKSVYFKDSDLAYTQLTWGLDNNLINTNRCNTLLELFGFKGHVRTILTLLFLSDPKKSVFRLSDEGKLTTYHA